MMNKIHISLILILAAILFFTIANKKLSTAETEANKICSKFTINQSYDSVKSSLEFRNIVSSSVTESSDKKFISISFSGVSAFDRYVCRLEFNKNKILTKEVFFID